MKLRHLSPTSIIRRIYRTPLEAVRARKVGWDWATTCRIALLSKEPIDFFLARLFGIAKISEEDGLYCLEFFGERLFYTAGSRFGPVDGARDALHQWRDLYWLDEYEANKRIERGMVVLDAGACFGIFSILASRLVGPEGMVIALEPVETNYECTKRNLESRGITNATVHRVAVGASDGHLQLSLSHGSAGAHSAVLHRSDEATVVPVARLDSLVHDLGLDRVDFIKADIEGMEPDMLRGATETIRRFRPRLCLAAYHSHDHRSLLPQLIHEIEPRYRTEVSKAFSGAETNVYAWVPE